MKTSTLLGFLKDLVIVVAIVVGIAAMLFGIGMYFYLLGWPLK